MIFSLFLSFVWKQWVKRSPVRVWGDLSCSLSDRQRAGPAAALFAELGYRSSPRCCTKDIKQHALRPLVCQVDSTYTHLWKFTQSGIFMFASCFKWCSYFAIISFFSYRLSYYYYDYYLSCPDHRHVFIIFIQHFFLFVLSESMQSSVNCLSDVICKCSNIYKCFLNTVL